MERGTQICQQRQIVWGSFAPLMLRLVVVTFTCTRANAFPVGVTSNKLGVPSPVLLDGARRAAKHAVLSNVLFGTVSSPSGDEDSGLLKRKADSILGVHGMGQKVSSFAQRNFFILGMVLAVSLARVFPTLGISQGVLRPELFIGKFGVTLVFLLSGLSLELDELKDAATRHRLNVLVQSMSFLAWPYLVGLPSVKFMDAFAPSFFPKPLLDGILILTCLPTTVNMCILLTSAAKGSVATALCNAVISNIFGIFATPALLLRFFGATIELPFGVMIGKLCSKVLLPVAIGQLLRFTRARNVYSSNAKKFKRAQEMILLGIVWNAFCNAFYHGFGLDMRHAFVLFALLPAIHISSIAVLFSLFKWKTLRFTPGEIVAATFCASQKTLAFGLPLINTVFEGSSHLAAYCAPIMIMHPLQLVIGSSLVPYFTRYTSLDKQEAPDSMTMKEDRK